MYAAPSSEMKRRSPRVVSNRSTPTRGEPPGEKYSHMLMAISSISIATKKSAVGSVHAIQEKFILPSSHAPEREALGDVVADEIDDERAGNDRQDAGRGKDTPIETRGGDRARHGRCDRFGVGGGK